MLNTGIRIKKIRKMMNYNQEKFASIIGTSRSNLSRIEKGEYPPSKAYIKLIINKFNVNPDWLLYNEEPIFFSKGEQRENLIPIIADIPAGPWENWIDSYAPGTADDYVAVPDVEGKNLFGIRVEGDSMEPKLFKGDILIIDPNKHFQKGIAVVRHHWGYKIRNVRRKGKDKYYIWPLNPNYDVEIIVREENTRLYVPVKVVSMRDI